MSTTVPRRGFLAAAAKSALVLAVAPRSLTASTVKRRRRRPSLALMYCEGENVEHQTVLATGTERELRRLAQEHAKARLIWEDGECEGDHPFAFHPDRPAEYHLVDDPT